MSEYFDSNCLPIAEKIAEIKNCSVKEVLEQTTRNCIALYDLKVEMVSG